MSGKEKASPIGLLFVFGLWLALGLMPILFGVAEMKASFGVDGVPGTAVVERCVDYGGSGKSGRTDCRGYFTADGSTERQPVELKPDSDEGDTFPARLVDGWAYPADAQGRLGSLALPALGLFFLLPVPLAIFALATSRRPAMVVWYILGVLELAAGGLCLVGLIASGL